MPLTFNLTKQTLELELSGNFSGYDNETEKTALFNAAAKARNILVKTSGLERWDSTLVVVLYELAKRAGKQKTSYDFSSLPENLHRLVSLALEVDRNPPSPPSRTTPWLEALGGWGLNIYTGFISGLKFLGRLLTSIGRFLTGKAVMRPVDFLFALEDCGYRAVAIVSLVSFMVGLILAFVGAIQLQTFGAQIYVASLVTIGMTRIMGAIMAGIIMAGRTGASYAAAIGTMQVNEEIDALKTMGIPVTDFLVLPRTLSLLITMPVLTVLADFMVIFGGTFVGTVMLIRSRQLARKVFCEGKCFGRYRGSLIAVAVTGGLLFADTLIYVCLYGVTAVAAFVLAFLAAAAMYLSFALKLRALERKKREKRKRIR